MKRSEQIGQLAAALAAAQAKMSAAAFDRENPHFRSKYATLASVMDALKPIHEQGLALIQSASVNRGDAVIVEIETTLAHKSGEWISESIAMKPGQDTPQAIGSAMTYGRRYLAAALCGIASDDDDDGNEASGKQKQPAKPAPKQDTKPQQPAPKAEPAPAPEKVEPRPAIAPDPTKSCATLAEKIKEARNLFNAQGVKTVSDLRAAVKFMLNRDIEGITDLSSAELNAVIAELQKKVTA